MNKKGMSLLEVLIAMVILAAGLLLISSSWSGTFSRLRKTQQSLEVAALLQRKITEIEIEWKGKPLDSIPEEKEDDFGSDYPNYRWKMESQKFQMPDLASTYTSREGGANEMLINIMKQFTDILSKSIKEVRVTVYYKTSKGREVPYSITTFFVDYDKDVPIPGLGGGP